MQSHKTQGVQDLEEKQFTRRDRDMSEPDYGDMPMDSNGYYHL